MSLLSDFYSKNNITFPNISSGSGGFAPATRTLPYGAGTYTAPVVAQPQAVVPPPPQKTIFQQPASKVVPPPPVKTAAPTQLPNERNANGGLYSPEEYANNLANHLKGTTTPGLSQYSNELLTQGPQTEIQLTSKAKEIQNAQADTETGNYDPYKVGAKSGLDYTPEELNAIKKAAAGVYDPALTTAFAKLEQKQKADALVETRKYEFDKMAQQHKYALEEKMAPTYAALHADASAVEGDFADTVKLVAGMQGTVNGQKQTSKDLAGFIANKDYKTAYAKIADTVESKLTGSAKEKFANSRTDYGVMEGMKNALIQYQKDGGDPNLLTGTEEEIKRKLGIDTPKASAVATMLWREFQTYRNNLTGAAFSEKESNDYASVNPSLKKSMNLNLAIIEGAQAQLENRVSSTIEQRVPSARYILEYAKGADAPAGGAPAGNVPADPEYLQWLQDNGLGN